MRFGRGGGQVDVAQMQAFEAGSGARDEGHRPYQRADVAAGDPWRRGPLAGGGGPVLDLPGPVGAQGEDVAAGHQAVQVLGALDLRLLPGHADRRVDRPQPLHGGLDFGTAQIGLGVEELPCEIRQFDLVVVDQVQVPDPGGGQGERHTRTRAADAEYDHGPGFDPLLRGPRRRARREIDPAIERLAARVAFAFARGEGRGVLSGRVLKESVRIEGIEHARHEVTRLAGGGDHLLGRPLAVEQPEDLP